MKLFVVFFSLVSFVALAKEPKETKPGTHVTCEHSTTKGKTKESKVGDKCTPVKPSQDTKKADKTKN